MRKLASAALFAASVLFGIGLLTAPVSAQEVTHSDAPVPPPGFALQVGDNFVPHHVFGVYVLPGETLDIANATETQAQVELQTATGELAQTGEQSWRWTAPEEPGYYAIRANTGNQGYIQLNVFVLTPFGHNSERLNGYRIGHYELEALRGRETYDRPLGFIEVNDDTRNIKVSPHFTLGQFLCKQQDGPPKYLLLRERLLLKLEFILDELKTIGVEADTLHVMSGFRTPWYNKSIGNTTVYSRHLYGGAADIFVDVDEDGMMDDLNGDGAITRADAEVLAELIEARAGEAIYQPFIGGLGIYAPAPHRGPFVHVDVRGYKARW